MNILTKLKQTFTPKKYDLFANHNAEIEALRQQVATLKQTPIPTSDYTQAMADKDKEIQSLKDKVQVLRVNGNDYDTILSTLRDAHAKELEALKASVEQRVVDESIRLVASQGINIPDIDTHIHDLDDTSNGVVIRRY